MGWASRTKSRVKFGFNVTFPEGHDYPDRLNWTALQAFGVLKTDGSPTGSLRLRFAAPFDDLVLVNQSTLTVQQVSRFNEAVRHFNAAQE